MQKTLKIIPIKALQDNYIWLIHHVEQNQCVVVDPGEEAAVLSYLTKHKLKLSAILVTHKHHDHTGGILALKNAFPEIEVYASFLEPVSYKTKALREKDTISLLNDYLRCEVYEMPGHTLGHIAYYYASHIGESGAVFTGDTLFSGGCGRLFEGSFDELYSSLLKLRALPKSTQIYCGHEYTVANLEFASWLEPDNQMIKSSLEAAKNCIDKKKPTLPSTLEKECHINPFLRCDEPLFVSNMQQRFGFSKSPSPLHLFTHLRQLKDNWSQHAFK